MQLEGVARHSGIHAAAVIVADRELTHYTPLMRRSKSTVTSTITQYEFPILESIGLLKVDFLGLSTLSVMREAARLIKERHGIEYTLDNIPFEGEEADEAFTLLSSGEVSGVFQVEGAGHAPRADRDEAHDVRAHRRHHLALPPRPDGVHSPLHPAHARRGGGRVQAPDAGADPGRDLRHHRLPGADHSDPERTGRLHARRSRPGAPRHQQEEGSRDREAQEDLRRRLRRRTASTTDTADAIYGDIEFFARYGFNKSHAADYAVITVQTAYLKAHYPVEYMAALLLVERDKTEKVVNFITECRRMGIDVLPPDVNYSGLDFDIQLRPPDTASRRRTATPAWPTPSRCPKAAPSALAWPRSRTWAKGRSRPSCGTRRGRPLHRAWKTSATASTCARSTSARWSA